MPADKLKYSLSETSLIALLLMLVVAPAVSWSLSGTVLVFLHFLSLFGLYLVLRQVADRLHPWAGHLLFGATTLILISELAIETITGLHLNRFVLSLLMQPDALAQIGLSRPLFALALMAAALMPGLLLWRTRRPAFRIGQSAPLMLFITATLIGQLLYAVQFYYGSTPAVETRRLLPFFAAPHPYQSRRALEWLLGPRPGNPFAMPRIPSSSNPHEAPAPAPALGILNRMNILLVVSDSLRAGDIKEDPDLAPNLLAWGNRGWLTLDHYSTSNCTHFSFYSMLTGRLPTGYGEARVGAGPAGLPALLGASGYRLSSAEQINLDWYNISGIFLKGVARQHATAENGADRQRQVTDLSLATLQDRGAAPYFHLAYYAGTHYPYSDTTGDTDNARYLNSIRQFDTELDRLLAGAEAMGALENTLVIVTSDHGEQFERGGATGHSSLLNDVQTMVPFLVLGGPKTPVLSHMDVLPYIRAVLMGQPYQAGGPVILANCDYAYPNGFAVLGPNGRADFAYDDGMLVPVHSPDGSLANKALQFRAATSLVRLLEKD